MGWNLFVKLGHLTTQFPNPTIGILGTAQEGLGCISHIFQHRTNRKVGGTWKFTNQHISTDVHCIPISTGESPLAMEPVVPHKAVAEVSKIGNYRRAWMAERSEPTDGSKGD